MLTLSFRLPWGLLGRQRSSCPTVGIAELALHVQAELVKRLQECGLKTTGVKAELASRLEQHLLSSSSSSSEPDLQRTLPADLPQVCSILTRLGPRLVAPFHVVRCELPSSPNQRFQPYSRLRGARCRATICRRCSVQNGAVRLQADGSCPDVPASCQDLRQRSDAKQAPAGAGSRETQHQQCSGSAAAHCS